jgi:hypothetical protein
LKLLILKRLTETLPKIPFSETGQSSLVPTSHWLHGKMRKNKHVTGGFPYAFKELQVASCMHFQCQDRYYRAFEAGYRKDFQH